MNIISQSLPVFNIYFAEEFIFDAFTDFFDYLQNTDFVCSKEETLEVIRDGAQKT